MVKLSMFCICHVQMCLILLLLFRQYTLFKFTLSFLWGWCYSIFSFICMFCRDPCLSFVLFLLTILLSVLLRYTNYDCPFDIFKFFFKLYVQIFFSYKCDNRKCLYNRKHLSIPKQLNVTFSQLLPISINTIYARQLHIYRPMRQQLLLCTLL